MINEVRETVLAIANKENFGYITPTDFNRYAVKAQLDIFTQLMYDYNHQVNKQNKRTTILGASVASNDDFADLAKRKLNLSRSSLRQLHCMLPAHLSAVLIFFLSQVIRTSLTR